MTSATPAEAIEARLRDNWTATAIFVGGNDDFVPPADADGVPLPYVHLEFPGGVGNQWGIGNPGNNAWREDGAFMLHVAVPTGTGEATARTWCGELAAIYRGQTLAVGVICYAPHPPAASKAPNGAYHRLSFGVPYAFQFLG